MHPLPPTGRQSRTDGPQAADSESMEVLLVTPEGAEQRTPAELDVLLAEARAGKGVLWVDVPAWDEEAAAVLTARFAIHPRAAADCANRNPVPKVHRYSDHLFLVLHAPERGARGHVHYVELDQFIGPGWLITVHGPLNPKVAPEAAAVETGAVVRRLAAGRVHPATAHELSYAVVTALSGRMRDYLSALTEEVWGLERQVTGGHIGNPEDFLEELFQVRHGLLTIRTMAALSREVYGRTATLQPPGDPARSLLTDLEDQFRRIGQMGDAQREYLQGVIEFYQTRTNTKMTIAAERLAVIAAVTLPVTAVSSIMGMNVIVNDSTHVGWLIVLLVIMGVTSVLMLIWARRQGWW
jgi:magnesium transporter